MHSTRHDSSLAALHASSGLPGQVVDVVVLSEDAGLLATLRESSSAEHAIWHAPSADLAVDLLVGGRCGILIADLATLRGDAASLLERLHAQFPELILLATGRRDEEHAVASLISNGRIYRFLHKPISPARAGVFISAATRRYHELRSVEPVALTTIKTIATRASADPRKIAIATLVAIVTLIAAIVWWTRDDSDLTASSPAAVGAPKERVTDLIARARVAYSQNRLSEPRGDNALDHFRAVLALQPDHVEAKQGVDRIVTELERNVVEALRTRNAAQGALALTALQRAVPDDPRVEKFHAELLAISRSVRAPSPAPARAVQPRKPRTNAPAVEEPAAAPVVETENTQAPAIPEPMPDTAAGTLDEQDPAPSVVE